MYNGNKTLQDINSQNIISENVSTDEIEANSILFKLDDGAEDKVRYTTNKDNLTGLNSSEILITKKYFDENKGGGGQGDYPTDIVSTSITNTNTTNDAVIHSNIFEADEIVSGSYKYKPVIKKGSLFLGDITKEEGNTNNRGNIINVNSSTLSSSYLIERSIIFGRSIYLYTNIDCSIISGNSLNCRNNYNLMLGSTLTAGGGFNVLLGSDLTTAGGYNYLMGQYLNVQATKHGTSKVYIFGTYNASTKFRSNISSTCMFDIGNGTNSARKSLFEIYRDGNAYLDGYFESKGITFTNEENTMTNTPKPIKYTTNYTGTLETGDDDTNIITTKKYVDDEIQSHSGGGGGYPDDIVCKTVNASKEFGDGEVYGDIIKSKTFTDGDITNQAKLVNASLTLGRASYTKPFNDVSYSNIICGGGGNTLTTTAKITESIFFGDYCLLNNCNRLFNIGDYNTLKGNKNVVIGNHNYTESGQSGRFILGDYLYGDYLKYSNQFAVIIGRLNSQNKYRTVESGKCMVDIAAGEGNNKKSIVEVYDSGNVNVMGNVEVGSLSLNNDEANTAKSSNQIIKSMGIKEVEVVDFGDEGRTIKNNNYLVRGDYILNIGKEIDVWEGENGLSGLSIDIFKLKVKADYKYIEDYDSYINYMSSGGARIHYNTFYKSYVIEGFFEKNSLRTIQYQTMEDWVMCIRVNDIIKKDLDGNNIKLKFNFIKDGYTREHTNNQPFTIGDIRFYGSDSSSGAKVICDKNLYVCRYWVAMDNTDDKYYNVVMGRDYEGLRRPWGDVSLYNQMIYLKMMGNLIIERA